jgi:hypothetical protein
MPEDVPNSQVVLIEGGLDETWLLFAIDYCVEKVLTELAKFNVFLWILNSYLFLIFALMLYTLP